jgi:hypothetical protein
MAVRAQLERILASPLFAGSPRMSRFLTFLVEETLAGRSDRIKEYSIAIEVFEKREDFDQRTDSTVRTEAGKLRAKLDQYYQANGRSDEIVISVPKGKYVPVFKTPAIENQVRANGSAGRKWLIACGLGIAVLGAGGWLIVQPRPETLLDGSMPSASKEANDQYNLAFNFLAFQE